MIIGVLLGSYAARSTRSRSGASSFPATPVVASTCGARSLDGGLVVLTALFSAALLFSVPVGELASEQGSALDTAADELGPGAVALGVLIGIGLFGLSIYGNAIALFDFVGERLPRAASNQGGPAGGTRASAGAPGRSGRDPDGARLPGHDQRAPPSWS